MKVCHKMAVNALTHNFNFLRGVHHSDKYSDLTLVTETKETIRCHRVIMAAVSKKLKISLDRSASSELVIRNVKYDGLKKIIDFVYDGRIDIEDTDELIDFSDTYAILQIDLGSKVNKTIENIIVNNTSGSESVTEEALSEPYHKCETCDKIFLTQSKFLRHMREVHDKKRVRKEKADYSCEKCGKIYQVYQLIDF